MIACPNLKNPDVAREFEELRNATTSDAAAYRIWSLNGGNHIDKAPNGAESILFKTLLEYYNGDRTKAIRAKAKLYSNSFLNWFGDWTGGVTVQVYQGRKTLEVDDRRYNYWSLDEDEVRKDYGQHVRSVRINPEGFLMKNVKRRHKNWKGEYVTDWTWSEEYEKVIEEFKQKTGHKYFDILENGEGGIKKQSEFFAFLEEKGYKGYMEYDLRMYDGDNHYAVTFGNQGVDEVSKVVDENGEPGIVYHWSRSDTKFTNFDVNKITTGGGFWFAKKDNEWDGKWIYTVYLNMKHPYSRQEAFDKKYGKGALGKIHQYLLDLDRYYNEVHDNNVAADYFPIDQDVEFNFTEPIRPTIEFSQDVIAEAQNILFDYDHEDALYDTSSDPAMYRSRDTRMQYEKLGFDGEFVGSGYIVVHNPNQIKFVDNEGPFLNEQINSEESEQEYTEQQVFDDIQRLDSELEEYISDSLTEDRNNDIQQATEEWGQNKQREIMGETQLHLAQAFGLTQQEDGTWTTDDNSTIGKLRVKFVNSMSTPGSIDFNEASTNAHTVIAIGLNEADASTFNHELAHYYIRTFWNSKAVQDALDMIYVKEMGDYKNDPAARIAVEEALADYMTQRTIDSSFLTNIESQSYFQRFWEAFNKMLYKVFNIKTDAARNAILSQITKSFYVNEKLDNNSRKVKYVMHSGTMYQTEAQRRRIKTGKSVLYQQINRSEFENTIGKIVKAIQSKAKSYQTQSIGKTNSVYGDEQQIAFNQESVRIVKEFSRTLGELQVAKDDAAILHEKFKLMMSFLERADEESNRVLRMFKNAKANDHYKRIMYNIDSKGNRQYEDTSNAPIIPATANSTTQQREFSWDDLQYAKNDIIGFFKDVIENIEKISANAQNFGLSSIEAQQLLDFIQTSRTWENVKEIEHLYDEARRQKCLEWIDETVDSREELDDDFKNRLKINMHKWLDEQMDFGDVSVFEKYAGMASMSKSPILRAFQDEISKMQQEKDEAVHKKALELRDKLAQARKEAGIKYRLFPFNIQKLLMQLDKHGLPTGNLISKYNQGQYRKDLTEYRDEVLFGKGGIEDKLKALKDSSGKPIFGKNWKLQLDEYDNLILPNNPLCHNIEKEYMKLIEDFKGDREIRRFTKQYYIDRINTLSTNTLRKLNELEERIKRITEAVTINGKLRIDLLTEDQQDQLKLLYDERSQIGSLTHLDGSYKVPGTEEFEIAEEIKAWRLKTRGKIRYAVDWVAYRDAETNTKDKNAFHKRFTKYVINPKIWDELQKFKINYPESDPRVKELASLKYDRAKLIAPYQGYEIGQFDWDSLFDESAGKIKNETFFENLKKIDERISFLQQDLWEDYATPKGKGKKQPQVLEELMIPAHLVPGVSRWRDTINSKADQSQYDFMLERIREAVNSDPSMNDTQKLQEILRLESLLQYHDAREDVDLSLSMFSVLLPINSVVTEINNKKFQSFIQMPTSIFQKVDTRYASTYVDSRYDDTNSGIQLTDQYLDKRYQKYFSEDSKLKELLESAQDCMKEGFKMIPFLQEYDGRMAQIGARTGQILGRKWYDPRRMLKNFGEFLRREWEVVETDTQFLQEEYETRPDGSKIQNIPLRFIRRLDDPEYISSDVIGSIIKFYDMAKNYQIKTRSASKLTSILNELSKKDNLTTAKIQGMWNTSQSEIVEGILGRQVFENKNVDSNSMQNFIENEWSHLDWFRRYVISNPATWLKRLSKSRAAFQLGMLALNFTSGIISFLDPLISMSIDTITGKYINYKDLAYAVGMLATNSVGNGLSLGSAKAYSKAAAGMQKFALSKSITESFNDLDQGQIMRFISDGLTMKHFTLGDYTINSINMIATMHNYKYYKKADGTAGFYPKHQYINIVMKDQKCGVREAKSIYNNAVCMWDSCKRDDLGNLVASNNEYGDAITNKTWNDVRSQVRSRSSIYNGIVPDLERSLMQTNIIWSFVTMLRNFFITGIWERFQSYRDFQVASLDEYGNPIDRPATQEEIKSAKKEQRYYKGGFNFAARQIEDGVDRAAFQWISNIIPYFRYAVHILTHSSDKSKYGEGHKKYLKEHNLSQTDIYGMQKIFMELMIFSILLLSSGFTQRWADDDQDSYWVQMLNLLTLRLTVERFTWFSPSTAMELISSPTAALSDWKRKLKLIDLTYDAIGLSDYKLHDEVKRGRYAGAERWKYNLFNGLSSFGLNNWYADTPEELGGGGARSLREKSNFYRGLVRNIPFGRTVIPRRDSEKQSKKKNKMHS